MGTKATASTSVGARVSRRRHDFLLAFGTLGYAIASAAWASVTVHAPASRVWASLDPAQRLLLLKLPLVVAAVGQLPVGALADRYGVRVVLAAVSAASAAAVVVFALSSSYAWLVTASAALGIAGTSFAVGAALVMRVSPVPGRGIRLSIFGAGIAGSAITAASLPMVRDPDTARTFLFVIAALLGAYSLLAAVVITNLPGDESRGGPDAVALLRLPATRRLAALYAVAFAPQVATVLILPVYLHTVP